MSEHLTQPAPGKITVPLAKRCWFFHQWSMWDLVLNNRQMRRCARCGLRQEVSVKIDKT